MTLYEIDQKLMELVDPETGELLDYEAFAAFQMEREEKIENMGLWVKELSAESAAIKQEIDNLAKRKTAADKKAESLKRYLSLILNGQKFKTPRLAVSFRSSLKTEIQDETACLEWLEENGHDCCIKYTAPTISKDNVKAIVKSGVLVPGVRLVENRTAVVK